MSRPSKYPQRIYVISVVPEGPCKIGVAADCKRRLRQLQNSHYLKLMLVSIAISAKRIADALDRSQPDRRSHFRPTKRAHMKPSPRSTSLGGRRARAGSSPRLCPANFGKFRGNFLGFFYSGKLVPRPPETLIEIAERLYGREYVDLVLATLALQDNHL